MKLILVIVGSTLMGCGAVFFSLFFILAFTDGYIMVESNPGVLLGELIAGILIFAMGVLCFLHTREI